MDKGAIISECGKYRYQLWRIWDANKPKVLFIMHNPSTADAYEDDPTIRRCIGFAKSWGYGGIYIGNLSPYRATNPKYLNGLSLCELFPEGTTNYVNEMVTKCDMHVLAFGNHCFPFEFQSTLISPVQWHYLNLTKSGNPSHPLYLKSDLIPKKMNNG